MAPQAAKGKIIWFGKNHGSLSTDPKHTHIHTRSTSTEMLTSNYMPVLHYRIAMWHNKKNPKWVRAPPDHSAATEELITWLQDELKTSSWASANGISAAPTQRLNQIRKLTLDENVKCVYASTHQHGNWEANTSGHICISVTVSHSRGAFCSALPFHVRLARSGIC